MGQIDFKCCVTNMRGVFQSLLSACLVPCHHQPTEYYSFSVKCRENVSFCWNLPFTVLEDVRIKAALESIYWSLSFEVIKHPCMPLNCFTISRILLLITWCKHSEMTLIAAAYCLQYNAPHIKCKHQNMCDRAKFFVGLLDLVSILIRLRALIQK